MLPVLYIESVDQATALLKPRRIELLKRLDQPRTCPQLAAEFGESAQNIYYHIKALEQAGLVEKVGERRVRGTVEGPYQARALAYWLSPPPRRPIPGPAAPPPPTPRPHPPPATPAAIYHNPPDPRRLAAWFAEHADIALPKEQYDFWGRFPPGAPNRDAGRHPLLTAQASNALSYGWRLQ